MDLGEHSQLNTNNSDDRLEENSEAQSSNNIDIKLEKDLIEQCSNNDDKLEKKWAAECANIDIKVEKDMANLIELQHSSEVNIKDEMDLGDFPPQYSNVDGKLEEADSNSELLMDDNMSDIGASKVSGSEYETNFNNSNSDSENDLKISRKRKFSNSHADNNEMKEKLHKPCTSTSINSANDILEFSDIPKSCTWTKPTEKFLPRMSLPENRKTTILANVDETTSSVDIFLNLFPESLLNHIAECTNKRLDMMEHESGQSQVHTDSHEIMILIGCLFIMLYNKLPAIHHYWSSNKSLGNEAIKFAISRDRFQLLIGKLYFHMRDDSDNNSDKSYYIKDVVKCLRGTFLSARSESAFQTIDESMAKFKSKPSGRSNPIQIWERCDSGTGYVYDFYIPNGGREEGTTLGLKEKIVNNLTSTIREQEVAFCLGRYFTSMSLLNTIPFAAVGACRPTQKNMPKFSKKKLCQGEFESACNEEGTLACLWVDINEVLVLSNCHQNLATKINRKAKDGRKLSIVCPVAIEFYNRHIGGIDLSDQLTGLHDTNRNALKWWKKVFYKLLLTTAINSWILYKETRQQSNIHFLTFLVELAESLIMLGQQNAKTVRQTAYTRTSNSFRKLHNVGEHLPLITKTRKRCRRCSEQKIEKRTTTICIACAIPLCPTCFTPYHTT